jgi:hypothetical protein
MRSFGLSILAIAGCVSSPAAPGTESKQFDLTEDNGITLPNGLNLANGAVLPNGATLPNGLNLANGLTLANGALLPNGLNLANGALLPNGALLANGVTLTNGISGPYICPAAGSDLELWIDSNPSNNLRVIKYLVSCALDPATTVVVQYRGTQYTYEGSAALGLSWQDGSMTPDDQEAVSACLMARINVHGRVLTVDLLGPMPGLDVVTTDDTTNYPYEELTFYGNVFSPTPSAYTCEGSDFGIWSSRACHSNWDCDIVTPVFQTDNRGLSDPSYSCSAQLTDQPATCARDSRGFNINCQGGGSMWTHVITVRTKQAPNGHSCATNDDCITANCAGGICGGTGASCTSNDDCVNYCASNVCGGLGAQCTMDSQCAGTVCSNAYCGGPGAPCTSDGNCAHGGCVGGTCGVPVGGSCQINADCKTSNCSGGVCGGLGAACSTNAYCAGTPCSNWICGGRGATCSSNAGCFYGNCLNGICGAPGASCSTNDACRDSNCGSGLCGGAGAACYMNTSCAGRLRCRSKICG